MSKPRVGYFVEEIDELPYVEQMAPAYVEALQPTRHIVYDFSPVKLMKMHFHLPLWRKYAKDVIDEPFKAFTANWRNAR